MMLNMGPAGSAEDVQKVLDAVYTRGYLAFGINSAGKIDVFKSAADPLHAIGLEAYVLKWSEAHDEISHAIFSDQCIEELGGNCSHEEGKSFAA